MKDLTKHKVLADKCPRNHDCLNENGECLCEIDYCLNNRVLFVNPKMDDNCPYMMRYGYSFICNCPLRMLIYQESKNKHNKKR